MIIVGDPHNKTLSEGLASKLGFELIYPEITVFPDSEQRVRVPEDKITGEKVYLIKSIESPVDSSAMQLSFIVDALNRSGADKVIGVVPYIPYMRADHVFRTGEAVPLELVIKMIENSGLNEIIIVDPHSIKIPEMFRIPVRNLSALSLFADKIKEIEPDENSITIVSPDEGGLRRLGKLNDLLGGEINTVFINKKRNKEDGSISILEMDGVVKGTCFVVDDIISTGETVIKALDFLVSKGAVKIYVLATHAIFSPNSNNLLQNSVAEKIYITNSIPSSHKNFPKLEVLSIADLIVSEINS